MNSLARALFGLALLGCTGSQANAHADDYPFNHPDNPDAPVATSERPENEPGETDRQALFELISKVSEEEESTAISTPGTDSENDIPVPNANELWAMSDGQCLDLLKQNHILTSVPNFKTPFVKTPLLLEGPINGVQVQPKWTQQQQGRVMDCRLIAALIELCRYVKEHDVVRIEFYSSWRPIKVPPDTCGEGKKGNSCRKKRAAYMRAKQGNLPSQHSRATAVDIRWFTLDNGDVIDVLFDYERNFKHPPCDDEPTTQKGIFLKELACHLNRRKVFNVILTPNADEAHDNHFHFDITPQAGWYIIR